MLSGAIGMLVYAIAFLWVGYFYGHEIRLLELVSLALAAILIGVMVAVRVAPSISARHRDELLGIAAVSPERKLRWRDVLWLVPSTASVFALVWLLPKIPLDAGITGQAMFALAVGAAAFFGTSGALLRAMESAVQDEVDRGLHPDAHVLRSAPSFFSSLPRRMRQVLWGLAGLLAVCAVSGMSGFTVLAARVIRIEDPTAQDIRTLWQAVSVWLPIGTGAIAVLSLGIIATVPLDMIWRLRGIEGMDADALTEHLNRGRTVRRTWSDLVKAHRQPQWIMWAVDATFLVALLGFGYLLAPVVSHTVANWSSHDPVSRLVSRFVLAFAPLLGVQLIALSLMLLTSTYSETKITTRVRDLTAAREQPSRGPVEQWHQPDGQKVD